ncbi:uncharacterized protein LOC142517753 isoform X3 [Primulina tabacum]|uniref:uncharacterized protein LOC142517753 isoform X3 n=1 Tax=Primulina tabacum TaxID=48773 RepID=UPI003F5A7957
MTMKRFNHPRKMIIMLTLWKYLKVRGKRNQFQKAMGFQRQKDVAEKGEQQKLHGKIGKEKKRKEGEFPELPNFSLELRQEEISEDIYGMTGKTPSRTLRKREKNVQKQIEGVCCDAWKYISFSKDENAEQRTSKMGFFPRSDIYRIENKL